MSLLRQVFRLQRAYLSHQSATCDIVARPLNRTYSTRKRSPMKPKRHTISPKAAVDIPKPPPVFGISDADFKEGGIDEPEEALENMVAVTVPLVNPQHPEAPVSTCFFPKSLMQEMSNTPGFPAPLPTPSHNPSYHIMSVPGAGVGVFAACDLKLGDLLMVERPLVAYPRSSHGTDSLQRALIREMPLSKLNALLSLKSVHGDSIAGILNTNAFHMPTFPKHDTSYTMVYNHISRLNHSCSPNAHLDWHLPTFSGGIRAIRPIRSGEEIVITYTDVLQSREERRHALRGYDFECSCIACNLPEAESAISDRRRADLKSLALDQADESGLEEWVGDLSLPDDYIIAACKAIWQEMEEEGCGYHLTIWPGLLHQICKAYCALGDVDGARNWARRGIHLSIAFTAEDGGWREVYDAPQETKWWKRRVRAKASAHKK